jgi:hypothetical protein
MGGGPPAGVPASSRSIGTYLSKNVGLDVSVAATGGLWRIRAGKRRRSGDGLLSPRIFRGLYGLGSLRASH